MYALCSDAMLKAITRQARLVDSKVKHHNETQTANGAQPISIAYFFDHLATDEDTAVMVTEQDYIDAHKELVPSVSADELRHYDTVRRSFEGAGKQLDAPLANGAAGANGVNGGSAMGNSKGKGKAKAKAISPPASTPAPSDEAMVIFTEDVDGASRNESSGSGSANTNGTGSLEAKDKGKGKGKASSSSSSSASASGHASKSSVDIAAGGFGDAGDDEELYG